MAELGKLGSWEERKCGSKMEDNGSSTTKDTKSTKKENDRTRSHIKIGDCP